MARLRAVRAGRAHSAGDAPAVVWVAGTVHGNEPAGGDADLRLLRDLAGRCHDPLLRRVVVVVLPDQNPDGRGMRTRVNVNGFDLNRDWLALTQPESQARLRVLLAMPPLAYVDQHEQGGAGFFAPPYSDAALPRAARRRARRRARHRRAGGARRLPAQGLPVEQRRDLRPALPRLRRQRHDAALRSGRDDLRVGRREPVRAARRRAPRGRRGRGALGRPPPRRAAEGVGRLLRAGPAAGRARRAPARRPSARLRLRARGRRRAARGPADGRRGGRPPPRRRHSGGQPAARMAPRRPARRRRCPPAPTS